MWKSLLQNHLEPFPNHSPNEVGFVSVEKILKQNKHEVLVTIRRRIGEIYSFGRWRNLQIGKK